VALLILVPVLLYLIGTLSPLQIVVERNPAEMRAGGACYVTMPAVRTLIQIREQCPTSHVLMPYPQQVRTGILFFDAQRNEPWARTVTTLYDAVFLFVDTIIEWTAAGMTLSDNIPQHAHAHREWLV
jgi:hypothetical protein